MQDTKEQEDQTKEDSETSQEKVRKGLINIFKRKSHSLPEWDDLKKVATNAACSPEEKVFATAVYYAIKDLLKPVGYNRREFIEKDNKMKTLTMKEYFISTGDPGLTTVNERIIKPSDWRPFKDIDLETLNKEQKDIPIRKMDNYLIGGTATEEVESYLNTKKISENIDYLFNPFIDTKIPKSNFEQSVRYFKDEPINQHAEPIPKASEAIEPEETGKVRKGLSFEDCFRNGKYGADFVLEIIEELDAIKKTRIQKQYLFGVIKALQLKDNEIIRKDDEIIRKEIKINKVYEIFCNKLGLEFHRISETRTSTKSDSGYQTAIRETKKLVETKLQRPVYKELPKKKILDF